MKTTTKAHKSHRDSRRCATGKLRYRDRREAIDALHSTQNHAARQLDKFGETQRREVRSYSCPICKGFHLASSPLTSDTFGLAA